MITNRVPLGRYCCDRVETISKDYDGLINYIDISSIDNVEKKIHTYQTIEAKEAPSRAKQLVQQGDILVSTVRPNLNAVAIVESLTENLMVCSTGYCVLRSNGTIDNRFLFYFCQSNHFIDDMTSQATGASYPAVNSGIVKNSLIPIYTLEQQKHISSQLDKVSRLIGFRKQQLSKLDELVKSRFIEMFGDPEKNPKGWSKEILCNHLNVVGGYAFKSELFAEDGIPVLRIGNINAGFFQPINMVYWKQDDSLSRYMMYAGDLVMSLTGTVGKDDYGNVCILGDDYDCYYLNQRNAKLELFKSLDKYYLSQILKFPAIKKKLTGISRGVRQANISNKDILNLEIPIPPIDLQNEFATFVEQTGKLKLEVKESLEKLETLKKSLMQKYFG